MCCKIDRFTRKRRNAFEHKKWLKALRLRYVWKFRANIMLDRTGEVLRFCAKQMIIHDVRKCTSINDACYAILRQIWRFDKASNLGWHDWTSKNGFTCFPWGARMEK